VTLERIESASPLRSIWLQPRVEFHQRFRPQPIDPPLCITTHLDQPGIAQHLEMARHPRLMHADLADQIAHRALVFSHGIEDPPPCRFGDHFENVKRSHRPSICHYIYMCKQMYRVAR